MILWSIHPIVVEPGTFRLNGIWGWKTVCRICKSTNVIENAYVRLAINREKQDQDPEQKDHKKEMLTIMDPIMEEEHHKKQVMVVRMVEAVLVKEVHMVNMKINNHQDMVLLPLAMDLMEEEEA